MRRVSRPDAIAPLQGRYLGDQAAIRARIEGVEAQTKAVYTVACLGGTCPVGCD